MKVKVLVIGGFFAVIILLSLTTRYYSWYEEHAKEKREEIEELRSDLKKEQEHLNEIKRALEQANEKLRYAEQMRNSQETDCNAWLKSCETVCTHNSSSPIPKHVHFISLNRPFSFHEWLAVVSARKIIKPDKITVYTDGQQDSCWWSRALPYIEHQLIHLLPGSTILNGVRIVNLAHTSDFLRASILYHYGGIYMDTDSLSLNSFDPFLSNQVVLARQCHDPVAIGVMMAQKHNCFICKYAHRSCQKFNGGWVTHSVDTMTALVNEVDMEKEGLLVLPARSGFYPMCYTPEGLHQLYSEDLDNIPLYNKTEIYAVHLFGNKAVATIFPKTLNNIDWIQNNKSLVAIAVRKALPSGFSQRHFSTTECASLELDD